MTGDEELDPRTQLSLRQAGWRDRSALFALDVACFGDRAWTRASWAEIAADPDWIVPVVTDGSAIVAASVLRLWPPDASIASLGVHPAYRRRGIGSLLLRDAVARAARSRARRVLLEVDADNATAIRLYRAERFAPLARFSEDGRARVEMVRRIGRDRLI